MALTTLYTFASQGEEIIQALGLYSNVKYQQGVTGAPKYQIGDFAQGGVVIWVTQDGEHGLVAAIEDLGGYYEWADSTVQSTITGATDSDALPLSTPNPPYGEYYAGWNNQNTIPPSGQNLTDYPAFQAATNYAGGEYIDWFLPSTPELYQMYLLKDVVDEVSQENGGFALGTGYYWSSRQFESNSLGAWYLLFSDGLQLLDVKVNPSAVRCVRAF